MDKGFVKNIVVIAIVLAIVVLSQQPYFGTMGKQWYSQASREGNVYWAKASSWFWAAIYPRASGEVAKRGEAAKEEITQQKNNAVKLLWEKVRHYVAKKFSDTFGTEAE